MEKENYVICKECSSKLKRISNTHLLKCCGLTMKEYSMKYSILISSLIIPNLPHRKLSPDERSKVTEKVRRTNRNKQIQKLTDEEEQIIIGSLLGDGYLFRGKKRDNSTYLILEHGIKQINYLFWKGVKLERLGAKFYQYYRFNTVKHHYTTYNQIRTKSLYILGDLGKKIYTDTGKTVPDEFLNKLKPLGLAIWFMDDGNYNNGYGSFCTQSFSEEDNEKIKAFFKDKYKINCKISKDGNNQCYISIIKEEMKKLIKIIEPFIFYQMRYKIGKEKLPECEVAKKVTFDSAHFLEEHEGKCENLHGGHYQLWVKIKGSINPETGMVMDYSYIKNILKKYIVEEFDHHCINYVVKELSWRSSTELICMYIWKVLIEFFPTLHELELHETEDSYCTYQGPSLEEMKKDKSLDILNIFKEKDIKWRKRLIVEFEDILGGDSL